MSITVANNSLKVIYNLLEKEMTQLSSNIASCFSDQQGLLADMAEHFINMQGKKLRPLLTILCSKALNYNGHNHFKLAAAVELIHLATLLHDDVIDQSFMRRGLPTVNALWGNEAGILSGNFLFSKAFKLMVETQSLRSMDLMSCVFAEIVEGEVKQLSKLKAGSFISIQDYFEIIEYKTAKLFSASCQVAAIISNAASDVEQSFAKLGNLLGLIYQIKDDKLDYFSNTTGKQQGADFAQGKITLPIILLYNKASQQERVVICDIFAQQSRNDDDFAQILQLLKERHIEDDIAAYITGLLQQINQIIDAVISHEHKKLLLTLVDFISVC
jgi:octaprenyl-diphosphate synthase